MNKVIPSSLLNILVPGALFAPMIMFVFDHDSFIKTALITGLLGLAAIIFVISVLYNHAFPKFYFRILFIGICLIALSAISTAYFGTGIQGLRATTQIILVLGWLFFLSLGRWTEHLMKVLYVLSFFIILVHLIWWIAAGMPNAFQGFTAHKNHLGISSFVFMIIMICGAILVNRPLMKYGLKLGIFLALLLVVASTSRSILLVISSTLLVYYLWPIISANIYRYKLFFIVLYGVLFSFIFVYIGLHNTEYYNQLETIVRETTKQNLYTGRNIIWPILLDYIKQKPIFGYGSGVDEAYFLQKMGVEEDWSAHNLYLATAIQLGLVGLFLLIFFLWEIWKHFYYARHDQTVRVLAAAYIGICVHQLFEVSLTQNNLITGIELWVVIGLGLSRVHAVIYYVNIFEPDEKVESSDKGKSIFVPP